MKAGSENESVKGSIKGSPSSSLPESESESGTNSEDEGIPKTKPEAPKKKTEVVFMAELDPDLVDPPLHKQDQESLEEEAVAYNNPNYHLQAYNFPFFVTSKALLMGWVCSSPYCSLSLKHENLYKQVQG